jgi:hypothetical protein
MGMIPLVYDTAQVVRILGEDGSSNYAKLDPDQPQAVTKMRDQNGAIQKIYNLGVGKYDVTITTGSSYATKRMEGADFITQMVQTSPDLMPIVGDLLFKSMDMPYSQEISDRMKKMMPPQLQDQGNGDDSPEVQQIKQQASQQIQQLQQQLEAAHQAMQAAEKEAQDLEQKANSTQGKYLYDMKKLEIDWYNAETERLQVELQAVEAAAPIDPERIALVEDAMAKMIDHLESLEMPETGNNNNTEMIPPEQQLQLQESPNP